MVAFNLKFGEMSADKTLEPWERISAVIGVACYDPQADGSVMSVFKRADKDMYEQKVEMKAARFE
ncbi:MAG: hypothetical protein J6Z82_04155 [Schwartzia sp.]|nr:hypothetical protein [Schwartzia sp. (in: firmicutes)]